MCPFYEGKFYTSSKVALEELKKAQRLGTGTESFDKKDIIRIMFRCPSVSALSGVDIGRGWWWALQRRLFQVAVWTDSEDARIDKNLLLLSNDDKESDSCGHFPASLLWQARSWFRAASCIYRIYVFDKEQGSTVDEPLPHLLLRCKQSTTASNNLGIDTDTLMLNQRWTKREPKKFLALQRGHKRCNIPGSPPSPIPRPMLVFLRRICLDPLGRYLLYRRSCPPTRKLTYTGAGSTSYIKLVPPPITVCQAVIGQQGVHITRWIFISELRKVAALCLRPHWVTDLDGAY
ncbi:uncharacterized protein EV420DRAFT_1752505 [Desarmillaria tabescens]|uniref:Uncharacterized protein n=1 Tax=Armillaria tabescens TaxID=1929756 RepID=A0AA39MP54_ARMTA|nr:uncharacterized protein EV420DRAFT_1752505 [Desarmillaria tabescens]KAK0441467.1 hypothetical protein EV420DRAFT_1752505 [Desarmillaria tabescens]